MPYKPAKRQNRKALRRSHRLLNAGLEPLEGKLLLTRLFGITALRDEIQEIDPQSGTVINSFEPPGTGAVSDGLAYDGESLWALLDDNNNLLYKMNPNDGTVLDTFTLPSNNFRNGLAALNGLIFTSEGGLTQQILAFNPSSSTVEYTIDIGEANPNEAFSFIGRGLAAIHGPDALLIPATDLSVDLIYEVDPVTGVINNSWAPNLAEDPSGVAVIDGEVYLSQHATSGINVFHRDGTFLRSFTPDATGYQGLAGDDTGTPSATDDVVETTTQTPIVIDLLANDHTASYHIVTGVTQPAHGTVTDHGDGTVTYDPGTFVDGVDTFGYSVGKQQVEVNASDAQLSDWYGHSVAIDGSYAVVGSPLDDDSGSTSGGAYVLRMTADNQWQEIAKLTPTDGAAGSQFGQSVAIDGDTVVVGAWIADANGNNSGAAYVFQKDQGGADNWGQVQRLTGSDTTAADKFGFSVAISGDTVVVGAHEDDPSGSASGAAYLFQRNQGGTDNWGEVVKLIASDGAAADRFGASVSVSGSTVAVGAWRAASPAGAASGAVYVFDEDQGGAGNWGEARKIVPADVAANDQFGFSVAIDGDRIVAGAHLDEFSGPPFRSNAGSVYIFERDQGGGDNWGEVDKIFADSPGAGDRFGTSVDLDGDWLVVGARFADGAFTDMGAAYTFQRNATSGQFTQFRQLGESGQRTNDNYGVSVAISNRIALAGAERGDSAIANNTGTAHFTDLRTTTANVQVAVFASAAVPNISPVSATRLSSSTGQVDENQVDSIWEELGTNLAYL
ncbi:MAG: Ig-like domain-containing protein [Pirellulaceae bacterium]|nr:hypothetical protein [Planctomycetales bacterium]